MSEDNSVFISYRRDNKYTALLVYKSLKDNGYDVFIDVELDSGGYAATLLNQIAARAHFVLILTPTALKRCHESGDWLRREIEYAMDLRRNIIPLMFDGFDFNENHECLTGKLAMLSAYQGVEVPKSPAYYEYAIQILCKQHLTRELTAIVHPTPDEDDTAVRRKISVADREPKPDTQQLDSEVLNARGVAQFQNGNLDAAIREFSRAIQLNDKFVQAYFNRASVREERQEYDRAIADYSAIIKIVPKHTRAYEKRAAARYIAGDFAGAAEDYTTMVQAQPNNAEHYYYRALACKEQNDLKNALKDLDRAIRLNTSVPVYYLQRGICRRLAGMLPEAGLDFTAALRLKWDYADAFRERGLLSYQRGELLKAVTDFNEYIRFCPNDPEGYLNRAHAQERRRNQESLRLALADYQQYLDLGGGENNGKQAEVERKIRDLRRKV